MSSPDKSISIVIPAHRRPDLLERCLKSLVPAVAGKKLIEIVVVENGGHANLELICTRYINQLPITYTYQELGNSGIARNTGLAQSNGQLVIFIDDDIKVEPSFVDGYIAAYEEFGDSRFYGGPLVADYEETPPAWLLPMLPASAKGFSIPPNSSNLREPLFLGGNIAIPRTAFIKSGGFDFFSANGASNAGYIGEETRIQQKLIKFGVLGCFVQESIVFHWVPRDRCSPEWLIARRKRGGETDAALAAQSMQFRFGFPLWMARAWIEANFRIISGNLVGRSLEKQMLDRLAVAYYSGFINCGVKSFFKGTSLGLK